MNPRALEIGLQHALDLASAIIDGFAVELEKDKPSQAILRKEYEQAFGTSDPAALAQSIAAFVQKNGQDEFFKQAGLAVQRQERLGGGGL